MIAVSSMVFKRNIPPRNRAYFYSALPNNLPTRDFKLPKNPFSSPETFDFVFLAKAAASLEAFFALALADLAIAAASSEAFLALAFADLAESFATSFALDHVFAAFVLRALTLSFLPNHPADTAAGRRVQMRTRIRERRMMVILMMIVVLNLNRKEMRRMMVRSLEV